MPKKSTKKTIFEGSLARHEINAEQDEFLEPEEHTGSSEDHEIKIHLGEEEADVYTEAGREELTEDGDEIAPWEEGFAQGATGTGQKAKCPACGKILSQDENKIVEREYRGETYWFCSDKCAKAGVKKK